MREREKRGDRRTERDWERDDKWRTRDISLSNIFSFGWILFIFFCFCFCFCRFFVCLFVCFLFLFFFKRRKGVRSHSTDSVEFSEENEPWQRQQYYSSTTIFMKPSLINIIAAREKKQKTIDDSGITGVAQDKIEFPCLLICYTNQRLTLNGVLVGWLAGWLVLRLFIEKVSFFQVILSVKIK